MTEDIVAIVGTFSTAIILGLGIPIIRSYNRRKELELTARPAPLTDDRIARIEQAVDAMALELERISEGQRFVTKLLAEQQSVAQPMQLPVGERLPDTRS
ncbi:MAG: hypothetical protein SFW08_08110 [Gemmatimonadaceae bacterium]|nr:hypothetical protein [Gemmatimonadaceae bacterium]